MQLRFVLVSSLLLLTAFAADAQDLTGPNGFDANVGPALEKSQGKLTPELVDAYVGWSEKGIRRALGAIRKLPPQELLDEIDLDPGSRRAIYGTAFPPDPSILQNYAGLQAQLSQRIFKKYHGLMLGVAVARRVKGIENSTGPEIGQENQKSNWIDEVLRAPANGDQQALVHDTAAFMKGLKVIPLQLFTSAESRSHLVNYLKAKNYPAGLLAQIQPDVQFGQWLMNAMIVDGQRPAARDPQPLAIDWLNQLIATYEAKAKSTPKGIGWPLYPVDNSPWPLLMPLVHTVPIPEANYIWESFQGVHGDDRFHTYGPYRDDLTAMPDKLLPSKWFWDAFPDRIVHGGECIPISKGTVDLYSSLGQPAMAAAQPGHSNLITFQDLDDTWMAVVQQDFCGGPHVTFSQWFFNDDARDDLNFRGLYRWAAAEYPIGLALGMNLGVDSYMDARIASNIFHGLSEDKQKTLGHTLLLSALEENPFAPDIWYRLFPLSDCDQRFAPARAIRAHNPAGLIPNARCAALDKFLADRHSGPSRDDLSAYWGNLEEFVARNYLTQGDGPQDEKTMMEDFHFYEGRPTVGPQELADFAEKFVGAASEEALPAETAMDQKLLDSGDQYGRFRMAQRYAGDGVPQNEAKAKELLVEGAKLGQPVASVLLDRMNPTVSMDGVEVIGSSTYSETQNVRHLIDGAGMVGGAHDNSVPAATMWQTVNNPELTVPAQGIAPSPAWVRFNFPRPQLFDAVEIWNHNQPGLTNRGFRNFVIYGSPDGNHWFPITVGEELPQAAGEAGQFGTVLPYSSSRLAVRSVIIAAEITNGNFGGNAFGLSAVRFVVRGLRHPLSSGQMKLTASSQSSVTQSVEHLIDGSGMTGEFHDDNWGAATMWTTADPAPMTTPAPGLLPSRAWVRFDFAHPRKVDEVMIWNLNQQNQTTRGFRKTHIYGTTNGTDR